MANNFVERILALPPWAWFVAAFMSSTLGSETWYWMLVMPFISLTRSIYRERMAVHAMAGPGDENASSATQAKPADSTKRKTGKVDKKMA